MYGPQATAVIYNGDEIDLTQKSSTRGCFRNGTNKKGVKIWTIF